jgi:murein L,D-transpeptidase YafK
VQARRATFLIAAAAAALLCMTARAGAGWEAAFGSHPNLPPTFLAVDKDEQRFFILSRMSPLKVVEGLSCATGQSRGDKIARGDLKTPEGVYFIETRLTRGLDYQLYGDQAFTLNFPNPVDRLKKKTGSGIWIHGRGHPVTPRETRGCVALNTGDLRRIQDTLAEGTPVAITSSLRLVEEPTDGEIQEVLDRVDSWVRSWRARSGSFLDHYDAARFARSQGESFAAFGDHKLRVFAAQPWIQVAALELRVLPGPDYWVTYFKQFYRTPQLTSEGVRRLYWQRDAKGELRIVGTEWKLTPLGLEKDYLESVRAEVEGFVESWRSAWEAGDLDGYAASYATGAVQAGREGLPAIRGHKEGLWKTDPPARVGLGTLELALHPLGLAASFVQEYQAAGGFGDTGQKVLVLAPEGSGWRIASEEWSPL